MKNVLAYNIKNIQEIQELNFYQQAVSCINYKKTV